MCSIGPTVATCHIYNYYIRLREYAKNLKCCHARDDYLSRVKAMLQHLNTAMCTQFRVFYQTISNLQPNWFIFTCIDYCMKFQARSITT